MQESKLSIVEQIVVVELQWNSIPMDRDYVKFHEKYEEATRNPSGSIIYAFEGRHAAYPIRSILYIGKTEADDKKKRPDETAKARFYGKPRIMSCVYSDMTLRWTMIPNISSDDMNKWAITEQATTVRKGKKEEETPAKVLERILIHAMKPALNSHYADGYLPSAPYFRKLLVCNKGDKGLLLPVVYGDFYAHEEDWEPY